MAQLQYGDENRRQVADLDREDYGVLPDDDQERAVPAGDVMPPPEVHHERHDPFEGHTGLAFPQAMPPGNEPRKAPSGHEKLDLRPEATTNSPVAGGFEGESMVKELEDKSTFQGFGVPEKDESRGLPSEGPPPEEEHAGKETESGSATGRGIIDVHKLKDDYVDLSETTGALPEEKQTPEVPEENQTPEELEGPVSERGGIVDVNSLKDDYIDLSEPKSPLPDEVVHEPEESSHVAPEEKPPGQSTEGGGIIDVHSLKDHFTDLSGSQQEPGSDVYSTPPSASPAGVPGREEAFELPLPGIDREQSQASEERKHGDTAQFTSQIESPADDPKQEEAAEIHEPIVDHEQLSQTLPQEEDDGSSKIEGEGLQHDDSSFSVEQEENALLSSQIQPPTNELEEERTAGTDFNKPESGGFRPDSVRDMQVAEEPPSSEKNIGVQDAEEIDRPESKVPDPTYVLGGRPECGIVVPEDSERNAQEKHVESFDESDARDASQESLDDGKQGHKTDATDPDVVGEGSPQGRMKEAVEEKENVTLRELPLDMAYGGAGISEGDDAKKREETSRAVSLDNYISEGPVLHDQSEGEGAEESNISFDKYISKDPLLDDQSEGAEERKDVTPPLAENKRDITSFDEQTKDLAHEPPRVEEEADVNDGVEKAEEMENIDVKNMEGDAVGQVSDEKSGGELQTDDYSSTHVPEEENKEAEGNSVDQDRKFDLGTPILDDSLARPPEEQNAKAEAVTTDDDNIAAVPGKDSAPEPIKFDEEEPDLTSAVPAAALAVGTKSDEQTVQAVSHPEDTLSLDHRDVQDTAPESRQVEEGIFPQDRTKESDDKSVSKAHGSPDDKESVSEEKSEETSTAIPLERNVRDDADELSPLEPQAVDYDTRDLGEQENQEGKASLRKEEEHPLLEKPIIDNNAISLPEDQDAKMDIPSSDNGTSYAPEQTSAKERMEFGTGKDDVSRGIPADIFTTGVKGDEQTTAQKYGQPSQALDLEQDDVQAPDIPKSEEAEEVVPHAPDDPAACSGIEGGAVPVHHDTGDDTHLDEPSEREEERRAAAAPSDDCSKGVPADLNSENVAEGHLIDEHSEKAEVQDESRADGGTESTTLEGPTLADTTATRAVEQNAETKREVGDEFAHPPLDSIARPPDTKLSGPSQDDVKGGFGGEELVPKPKVINRDMELPEAMEQEEERKRTDVHPLDRPPQKEGAAEGEAPLTSLQRHVDARAHDEDERAALKEGEDGDLPKGRAVSGHGKEGEGEYGGRPGGDDGNLEVQSSVQPENLGDVNIKTRDSTPTTSADRELAPPPVDDQPEHEHHKKGVLGRIKEKLTPPFHIHSH